MSAPSNSRRETAGSVSSCPDFLRERCVACLRAIIQTKDQTKGQTKGNESSPDLVVMKMRRNIDLAAKTRRRFAGQNSIHHNIVIPASE
jgi:hypothetical protein